MGDIVNRLESLKRKHRELDERIEVCYAERINELLLKGMKTDKLKLKTEIDRLETELGLKDNET